MTFVGAMGRCGIPRLAFMVFGLASAMWCLLRWDATWRGAELEPVADRIEAGDSFQVEALARLRPKLDAILAETSPQPDSLRSVALIDLRLAELEVEAGNQIAGNPQFGRAEQSIRTALGIAPSDAFLWAALFWLAKTRDGFRDEDLGYLRMSYATGPHEGWVAFRRNRQSVALLPLLPTELRQQVIEEFRTLVASNDIGAATQILTGPGWGQRDELIKAVADATEEEKRQLDAAVFNLGFDISIPGVVRRGSRPWK